MERLYLVKLNIVWESAQVKTIEYQIIFPQGWQSSLYTVNFNHSANSIKTSLRPHFFSSLWGNVFTPRGKPEKISLSSKHNRKLLVPP